MLKFNKNKKQTFECKVEIEGADYTKTRPRLVLSPTGDNKHIFFEGKIDAGTCKVIIPEGLEIARNGEVVLEVLVDNTMFTPWKSTYEMLVESVKVNEVAIKKNEPTVKVIEEKVAVQKPKVTVTVPQKPKGVIKEGLPHRHKRVVEEFVASYKKLSPKDRTFLRENILSKYKPSKSTRMWAESVFNETTCASSCFTVPRSSPSVACIDSSTVLCLSSKPASSVCSLASFSPCSL